MTRSCTQRFRAAALFGLALACLTLSGGPLPQTWAQTPVAAGVERLLPANTAFYLGMDGSIAHQAAWEKTAAYEALDKTGLTDLIRKTIVYFVNQAGVGEKEFLQVFDQISRHGVSVAVALPEGGLPIPQALVVLHEGKSLAPALDAFFQQAAHGEIQFTTRDLRGRQVTSAVVPNSPGVEFGWWVEGEHFVLTGGIGAVDAALAVADKKTPNITTHPLWKRVRQEQAGFEVSVVTWLDFPAIRAKYGELEIPREPLPPLAINKIVKVLGLENLGVAMYRSGTRDRATWSETIVDAPGPRSGLLALCDQSAITVDDLPPMPASTAGFYASSIDWTKSYNVLVQILRDAAREIGPPEAPAQLEAVLDQAPQFLGFDLAKDLFDPLGNVVAAYGDQQQGVFGIGFVLASKVDDAATLRKTVALLMTRLAAASNGEFTIKSVKKYGRELTIVQMGQVPVSPTLVVDDRWLALGLTTQSIDSFLLRGDGKLPRWKFGDDDRDARQQLPAKFTSITMADPRETIKSLLGLVPMGLTAFQAAAAQGGGPDKPFPIRAEDIPSVELVTAPLFPNVSVSTVDNAKMLWQSRSSVSSVPLLGSGGSGTAATATLVALLLPAVQQARTAARRAQSINNLKQFGLALHNYHDVHNHFPQGTAANENLKPEKRLSWQASILPYLDQAAVYNQIKFDKAWDDPANANLVKLQLPVYQNPQTPFDPQLGNNVTHYIGWAGLGENGPTLPVKDPKAGVFAYNRATRILDITDGTSNTVAVSEANKDFGPWAAGGRATMRSLTKKPYINGPDGIGSSFPGGCNVLFCDGSVRFISQNVDPQILEKLATVSGGEVVGAF